MINSFFVGMIIFLLYTSGIIIFTLIYRKNKSIKKIVNINIFIMYLLILFALTLLPQGKGEKASNFIPFANMLAVTQNGYVWNIKIFFRYILSSMLNILLFMPLGFFVRLMLGKKSCKTEVLTVVLAAFSLSLFIEFMQFALPINRVSDIDDIIFNTLGGLIGVALFETLTKIKELFLK